MNAPALLGWVRATHAPPTFAVTAFFAATALAAGAGLRTLLLVAAVLVGQASVGWANDYLDAPLDRTAGRADKPVAVGVVSRRTVGVSAAVALAVDVPLSLALGWRPGAAHLAAVGWAWLYDVRLKFTPLSALPFLVSFGLVPVVVATMLPGHPLPQLSVVAAAGACGVAAHFANTLGDVDADRRTDVWGLPQRLGPSRSAVIAAVTLAVACVLLVVATEAAVAAVIAAVVDATAAFVVVVRRRERRQAFVFVIVAVAVLVAAFVGSGGHHLTA